MKTKKEILRMNKEELNDYKWSDDLNPQEGNRNCLNCLSCSNCLNCSNCFSSSKLLDCSNCSNCSDCSDCYKCRNLKDGKNHQYKICNVQLTKKEYKKKMEELI